MSCDRLAVTAKQKQEQADAVKAIEMDIATGAKTLVRQLDGSLSISNWATTAAARIGMCEGCVLERMAAGSNWVVKAKLQQYNVHRATQYLAGGHLHGKGHR
jgi:hypothetical protein